jgi:hypothetical protein
MMQCYCCKQGIKLARKVKLRPVRVFDPALGGPSSYAYQLYMWGKTYRSAFVCDACYATLDSNETGIAEIPEHGKFQLRYSSQGGKAPYMDEKFNTFDAPVIVRAGEPPI